MSITKEKQHFDTCENIVQRQKVIAEQSFRLVHPNAQTRTHLTHELTLDGLKDYKFSLNEGIGGNYSEGICYIYLIHSNFRNEGKNAKVHLNLAIENPDSSVENLMNVTFYMLKDQSLPVHQLPRKIYDENYDAIFSSNGDLTLICKIAVLELEDQANKYRYSSPSPSVFMALADKFSDANINPLTPNDDLGDVILHVGENTIYCHKLVLGLTSKYFETMFTTDMKEKNAKDIPLQDFDLDTVKALLNFMYKDIIDDKVTVELLAASDMYDVMRLREICIQKLTESLDVKNVAQIWYKAYQHRMEELMQNALLFMAKNWKILHEDENVLELVENYPKFNIKLLSLLGKNQK